MLVVFYIFAFPPLVAWTERKGVYSEWIEMLEPDYQTVATHLPWLSDYYNFCLVYQRSLDPPG